MNLVILKGNVGSDPELFTGDNWERATFSLATSRRVKEGETWVEKTTWHRCVAWNRTAKVIGEHVTKGTALLIRGRIDNRKVDKDGVVKYFSNVIVDEMEFAGKREGGGSSSAPRRKAAAPSSTPAPAEDWGEHDDDIPF